jgi:diguanylate cyclase
MSDNAPILDPLTGFINRKGFEEKLKAEILDARLADRSLSIAFIDIDCFMRVNDSIGHEAGDVVIKAIGDTIQRVVTNKATICRYGGDEFTIIFPNMEREQAFLLIESARAEIAGLKSLSDGKKEVDAQVTVSGGVAAFPIDAQDESELIRKAGQAFYKAKATGRNKIVLSFEEKMAPKTSHFTLTQLERLTELAREQGVGEAVLLREALDDLLTKYKHAFVSQK